jgi:hypothetical protein
MIEGTHEVVTTIVWKVPPGIDPQQVVIAVTQGGLSVAAGMMPNVKSFESVPRKVGPAPSIVS